MRLGAMFVAAVLLVAACGDNEVTPDAEVARCAPEPGPLPTSGPFLDPNALPLAGCVEGGLAELPGRWFLVAPEEEFSFFYPAFEGDCDTGFRRSFVAPDDPDDSDGQASHSWSDGTRIYSRRYFRFEFPESEDVFEFASAFAACMQADGTLAAVSARFDTDRGETTTAMIGTRFGLKDEPATGLSLLGEVRAGPAAEDIMVGYNVVVEGTHAYVVGPAGLHVVDVADPAAPVVVGRFVGAFNDVRVVEGAGKRVAFVAPLQDDVTLAIDVTDPTKPTLAHTISEFSHSLQVATSGATTHLYLANYTDGVPQFDVTNPVAPVRIGAAPVPGEPSGVHDLTVDGDRLYVNYTDGGFVAVDISGGLASATEVGHIDTSYSHASWVGTTSTGRTVVLHGDEGMTGTEDGAAFLRILEGDRASPNYMTEIGRYRSRLEVGIHNIQMVGDLAYIAYYQDGVRVVDVSVPEQPREVAHFNTWDPQTAVGAAFEGAVGIRVAGDRIYVADSERGLLILE